MNYANRPWRSTNFCYGKVFVEHKITNWWQSKFSLASEYTQVVDATNIGRHNTSDLQNFPANLNNRKKM